MNRKFLFLIAISLIAASASARLPPPSQAGNPNGGNMSTGRTPQPTPQPSPTLAQLLKWLSQRHG
ncbi:MAG: hypothetical protein JO218_13480 [Burkholderiales bacterium]|nr:hypothetical protein [Burkholderiales bacterium]